LEDIMSTQTLIPPTRQRLHRPGVRGQHRAPTADETTVAVASTTGVAASAAFGLTRITLGFVFLWAFLDKVFGLGYTTTSAGAWINGGSPTKGFLSHVSAGPLQSMFNDMAGNVFVDWLFMLALLGIGVAVIAGVALRPAAIAGVLLMAMMWLAEWPLAKHGMAGPTGSTNPIVDYHVIYALGLVVLATIGAGRYWGLGEQWQKLPVVRRHSALR
jgi:thiosulfate dehydrogenase [quinone] large subunit